MIQANGDNRLEEFENIANAESLSESTYHLQVLPASLSLQKQNSWHNRHHQSSDNESAAHIRVLTPIGAFS